MARESESDEIELGRLVQYTDDADGHSISKKQESNKSHHGRFRRWVVVFWTVATLVGMGWILTTISQKEQEPKHKHTNKHKHHHHHSHSTNANQIFSVRIFALNRNGTKIVSDHTLEGNASSLENALDEILDRGVVVPGRKKHESVGVVALGRARTASAAFESRRSLERLAATVDHLLTPRLQWRLVAERMDPSHEELWYSDPSMIATTTTTTTSAPAGSIVAPAFRARSAILQELRNQISSDRQNDDDDDESLLGQAGVDFVLTRITDPTLEALARALRSHQFPGKDCDAWIERTGGRTMVDYGGSNESLGAWTNRSVAGLTKALTAGIPHIPVLPKVWAGVYQFHECRSAVTPNGLHCGFLPTYGGTCLEQSTRLAPTLDCLAGVAMGDYQALALPRDGIPKKVCRASRQELPVPILREGGHSPRSNALHENVFDLDHYPHGQGPPSAWTEWCPHCGVDSPRGTVPTPAEVNDPRLALGRDDLLRIEGLPLSEYISAGHNDTQTHSKASSVCSLEIPPLRCEATKFGKVSHTCCYNELGSLPIADQSDNALSQSRSTTGITTSPPGLEKDSVIKSALGGFVTRFNRASRKRIAAINQPRLKTLGDSWKEALATGQCATLHIRRGDNIDRCQNGEKQFCGMDKTLADYMETAVPLMERLAGSSSSSSNSKKTRHVFVMTDDPSVAKDLKPWTDKGYVLEVSAGHHQSSLETYRDWDPFLESLHLARSCRVFVGHHISTVSELVYMTTCFHWGACPLATML